jgi:hypothetical protein
MSPDMTAQRILSQHYKALRQALYLPYGLPFRVHLRSMLDRIGILNSKMVQSGNLKQQIEWALVEASAVIDLTRLQELMNKLDPNDALVSELEELQQDLDDYFRAMEQGQKNVYMSLKQQIVERIQRLNQAVQGVENDDVMHRIQYSLNNIQSSLCHVLTQQTPNHLQVEAQHG